MPWIAPVASAVIGGLASNQASKAQEKAAGSASAVQRYIFDQTREDQEPWRQAGLGALSQLTEMSRNQPSLNASDVMAEPGYQFGLDQGNNNIQGSAAARGGLYSGNALKALTRYGNDYATTKFNDAFNRQQTEFGNRWSRISSLAGIGQAATNQVGQAGANFANSQTNLLTGLGNAQGANAINQGNIWGNALNQGVSAYQRQQQPGANVNNPDWYQYDLGSDGAGGYYGNEGRRGPG